MAASTPDTSGLSHGAGEGPEAFGMGALFWRISDGLIVIDPETSAIALWNPAAEALFGYGPGEILGRPVACVIPAGLPAGASPRAAFEVTGRHQDGRALPLEVSLSPIARTAAPTAHLLAIVRDVTERRRFEAALVERTEALEAAVAELRRADRYKDEFLAALSHELRTPITSIVGYAEFLADDLGGPLTADQRAFVEEIDLATQRLLTRVDDVLDLARLQADAFHLDVRPTDLAWTVREAAAAMRGRMEAAGVGYRVDVPEGEVWGPADGRQIARMVAKLLDNAAKFTPRGGQVAVRAAAGPGGLRVEVADTGCGIAPEGLPRLFERFWQADMSSTRVQGGLGLGLPIARAIVERHGGTMDVRTAPGAGSTFWFVLPIAEGDA